MSGTDLYLQSTAARIVVGKPACFVFRSKPAEKMYCFRRNFYISCHSIYSKITVTALFCVKNYILYLLNNYSW
jgi:hypothetical protein